MFKVYGFLPTVYRVEEGLELGIQGSRSSGIGPNNSHQSVAVGVDATIIHEVHGSKGRCSKSESDIG